MQMAEEDKNIMLAVEYAKKIREFAPRDHACNKAAKEFLKKHPKEAKEGKGFWSRFGFWIRFCDEYGWSRQTV